MVLSRFIIRVSPFRALITLLITFIALLITQNLLTKSPAPSSKSPTRLRSPAPRLLDEDRRPEPGVFSLRREAWGGGVRGLGV